MAFDLLGVGDELDEVVGHQLDLLEKALPPGPEVRHIADQFDDLLVFCTPPMTRFS